VPAAVESLFRTFPIAGTLDQLLGFELLEADGERCRARFEVTDSVKQPTGLVHGGAYAALAESMASIATNVAVEPDGNLALGQANSTMFLRPVDSGAVEAEGLPLHRGRATWIWDVTFTDADGRLCAVTRMTVAVRPQPG
jgi:1,4-dihydroxy-2-naphthoyl-CoA hydrolase